MNECKYCDKPNKNGTGKAAHERHCVKNPDHQPTIQEQRASEREANPDNRCPECEAAGEGRGFDNPGALMSHRVKSHDFDNPHGKRHRKSRKPGTNVELVPVANGTTPAAVRRHLQSQQKHRADLASVVQIVFPNGIPTNDTDVLDSNLGYVFQTAQILERRG